MRVKAPVSIKVLYPLLTAVVVVPPLLGANVFLYIYSGAGALNSVLIRNIIVSAAAALVLLTIVIVKSRRLSRRLVRLIDTAEEYENGFFEVTLNPAKKDRMGLLTAAFIELGKALERLSRYTNKQVIELAREDRTPLEAESPEAALLVIRINNFRQLTRPMTGEETSELLNLFLARINPCISKTGGVINTFWTTDGFSLLAVWGKAAAVPNPRRNAEAALRSCVLIHAAVKTVNRDLAVIHARRNAGNDIGGGGDTLGGGGIKHELPRFAVSMGVDSGEVIMGPAGGSHRKENIIAGTVLKNAVYAAQRGGTEGAQTGWGVSTLMTSTVYALVKKNYTARALTENTDIPLFMLEKSIISGEQNVYTGNQMPLTAEGNRFCHH